MQPLKLWLQNKHFATSNFKEKRVVWHESSEEINQSIEARKDEKAKEIKKLSELKKAIKKAKISNTINDDGERQALHQIQELTNKLEKSLSTFDLSKISTERNQIQENLMMSEFLKTGVKRERTELGELVARETKSDKPKTKKKKPNPQTIVTDNKPQEKANVADKEAEIIGRGGEGAPEPAEREESVQDEQTEQAKKAPKSTDTVKTTKIEANAETPTLSFPIAINDLKKLEIELGAQKPLSTLESTHDLSKGTLLLFPKNENTDKSIYLKISDTEAVRLNGVHNPSNAASINAREGYDIVSSKIDGQTQIVGAKKSKETKDPLQPEDKVEASIETLRKAVDENKTKAEIDKLALDAEEEISDLEEANLDSNKLELAAIKADLVAIQTNNNPEEIAKEANLAYNQDKFQEAIALYKKAYEISQATAILYNIALIYDRKLDDPRNALKFYKDYISKKDADPKAKKRAEKRISEIEKPKVGVNTPEIANIISEVSRPYATAPRDYDANDETKTAQAPAPALAPAPAAKSPALEVKNEEPDKVKTLAAEAAELYKSEKFLQAIKKYEEAYKIEQVSELLYNIAYIHDNNLPDSKDNALKYYKEYVKSSGTDQQTRIKAEDRIKKLESTLNEPLPADENDSVTITGIREKPSKTPLDLTPPEASLDRIHDTTLIVENSEFANTLNHNPEKWNGLYDRLQYKELYNNRFEKQFGLSKHEAPAALKRAFEIGLNNQIQFEDLLAVSNTAYKNMTNDKFLARTEELKTQSTETYEQLIDRKRTEFKEQFPESDPEEIAMMINESTHLPNDHIKKQQVAKTEFDAMQTLFNAGHDILTHLKKEDALKQVAETKFESPEERKQNILDKIDTEIEGFGWQTILNHEFTDAQGLEVGITTDALNQFRANFDYKGVGTAQLIQLLSRAYTLKELIAQNKVAKSPQGDIIITALPNNFDPKNPKIQELAATTGLETLGTEPEFGNVDQPELAESHANKATEFRNALSSDPEVKKAHLLKLLLSADKRSKSDIVENPLHDLADLTTEITIEGDEKHELVDSVITETSPQAMANNLFDRQTVQGFTLFTIDERGNKKINEKAYINYFNHLMEQGELVRARQKFQEKPDINVGEITEKPKAKYIEANQSPFDLSDAQIDTLRLGYAHELLVEKHQQKLDLAKEPDQQTKAIHQALLAQGYPKNKPLPTKESIIGALGILFKGKTPSQIGAGLNLPLGEGFGLHIGADTAHGPEFGLNLAGTIYKDGETHLDAGAALNIPLGRIIFADKALHPELATGAKLMLETKENWDVGPFVTTILGVDFDDFKNSGLGASFGVAVEYNRERARKNAFNKLELESGLRLNVIESKTNPTEKLQFIKKLPEFTQFNQPGKELSDPDQLAIYEEWANQITLQAEKNSAPDCPITGIYAGATLGIPPTLMLGFKIQIGEKIYFRPTRAESDKFAHENSDLQLQSALKSQDYKTVHGDLAEVYESGEFYIDAKGNLALAEGKYEPSRVDENKRLNAFSESLAAQNLSLSETTLDMNGQTVKALELKIFGAENRNTTIQLNPNDKDIQVRVDQNTGKTYLFGNLKNLTITRQTFRYQRNEQVGGTNVFDVITISKDGKTPSTEVRESSALLAEKRIVDGKPTSWEMINGAHYNQFTNIRSFNPNEQSLETTSFFDDIKIDNTYRNLAAQIAKPKPLEQAREDWDAKIPKLYNKLKNDLEKGTPNIADYNEIVKLVNTQLADAPEMNAAEAGKLLTTFQDLYFSDLLKKAGNDKDKLLETFNKNNDWIVQKVLLPEFTTAITRLNLTLPTGQTAQSYALKLATDLKTMAQGKFAKMLSDYKPESQDLKTFLEAKAKENRQPNLLFKSGTAIRETGKKQQGLLSGQMVSDLEALGGLYLVDDIDANSDLEKVVTEIMLPRPSLTVEGLATPTALKLAAVPVTGQILGLNNYKKVVDYYTSENKEITNENRQALQSFVDFTHRVIDGQEKGFTTVRGALYGTYFKCGNLSLAAREKFTFNDLTTVEGGAKIAGNEQPIFEKYDRGIDTASFIVGIAANIPEDQPKPTPTPKKDASEGATAGSVDKPNNQGAGSVGDTIHPANGDINVDRTGSIGG